MIAYEDAFAELRSCGFWTAHQRLFAAPRDSLPFIKHIQRFLTTENS